MEARHADWTRAVVRLNPDADPAGPYGVIVDPGWVLSSGLEGVKGPANFELRQLMDGVELEAEGEGPTLDSLWEKKGRDFVGVVSLRLASKVPEELWIAIETAVQPAPNPKPFRGREVEFLIDDHGELQVRSGKIADSDGETFRVVGGADDLPDSFRGAGVFSAGRLLGVATGKLSDNSLIVQVLSSSRLYTRLRANTPPDPESATQQAFDPMADWSLRSEEYPPEQQTRASAAPPPWQQSESEFEPTKIHPGLPDSMLADQTLGQVVRRLATRATRQERPLGLQDLLEGLVLTSVPPKLRHPVGEAACRILGPKACEGVRGELAALPPAEDFASLRLDEACAELLWFIEERALDQELGWPLALFAALLFLPGKHRLRGWLAERAPGVDIDARLREERGRVLAELPRERARAWRRVVGGSEVLEPPTKVAYAHDRPGTDDALDIEDQATRFAKLIADPKTRMPLSLGLFGDWGTGKSHFMRLLQKQLSKRDKSIAQIEFNAWHFMDANLWASMGLRIYEGLAEAMTRKSVARGQVAQDRAQQEYEQIRLSLVGELESQRAAQERARQLRKRAEEEHARLREQLALKREAWGRTREELGASVLTRLVAVDISEELHDLEPALRWLGYDKLDSPARLERLEGRLAELADEGRGSWAAIVGTFAGPKVWRSFAWLLGIVAVVIGLEYAGDTLDVESTIAEVAAALTGFVALVGRRSKELGQALDSARSVRSKLAAALKTPEDFNEDEQDLRKRMRELEEEIVAQEAQANELGAEIVSLSAELERIDRGGLVYDFLAARDQDRAYRDELGIISTIREDLGRLAGLLEGWRKQAQKQAEADEGASPAHYEHAPKRIVLYIDDLDRCPVSRVVEVLQAVHLLLAFDLFAVVVAVDPRWLARSLYKRYVPEMFQPGAAPAVRAGFDPQNYLEKIFQIPFSLPSMDEDGFQKLVALTLDRKAAQADGEEPRLEGSPKPDSEESPGQASSEDSGAGSEESEAETEDTGSEASPRPASAEERSAEADAVAGQPGLVPLYEWERDYLSALHAFVPTPRLTKRLINIYRLLRLQATNSRYGGFESFADRSGGDYRAVLVLLGVAIGYPHLVRDFLDTLVEAEGSFLDFVAVNGDDAESDEERGQTRALPARQDETPRRLAMAIRQLADEVGVVSELEPYKRWAPHVRRFTFTSLTPAGFLEHRGKLHEPETPEEPKAAEAPLRGGFR